MDTKKIFKDAVLAGIYISLGGVIFLSVENRTLGAFLFSIGLCAVCVLGAKLFTGALCTESSVPKLALIYTGNFAGACLIDLIRLLSGLSIQIDMSARFSRPLYENFFRGIICEICIYIAVMGYRKSGQLLMLVLGVMVFILCGAEHCVADMFYALFSPQIAAIPFLLSVTAGNTAGAVLMRFLEK